MRATEHVLRRTYEAAKHPEGSPERTVLNGDALTSEWQPSYRYLATFPYRRSFRTKGEALAWVEAAMKSTESEADK